MPDAVSTHVYHLHNRGLSLDVRLVPLSLWFWAFGTSPRCEDVAADGRSHVVMWYVLTAIFGVGANAWDWPEIPSKQRI